MLEVEDVENVACTVDDMEATDSSKSLVQRGLSEGRGRGQEHKAEMMKSVLGTGGARL